MIKINHLFKEKLLSNKDSLTHVYTYSQDQLLRHFAWQMILEKDAKKLILIGHKKDNEKIISIFKSSYKSTFRKDIVSISDNFRYIKDIKKNIPTVIIITTDEPNSVRALVQKIKKQSKLAEIKVVYKISVAKYHSSYLRNDLLPKDISFVDDMLDYSLFNSIYEESLKYFELKCQVKDALDVFQSIQKTIDVPGVQIEVGSYKGHSGWLINQFSTAFGIKKKLYMCDTFEKFPKETWGIDKFWSGSHVVNFLKVKDMFKRLASVTLVKGDIRLTLPKLKVKRISFLFIDVDSYDATIFALRTLCPKVSKGGIVLCEDYGESHCLGARMAIDEYFTNKQYFSFTSFYSGCKVFFKL